MYLHTCGAPDTLSTNAYVWYGGAVQQTTIHDSDTGSGSNPLWTSTYTLNALGQLVSVAVNDGIPKTVTFTNDEAGQIIRRDESRNSLPGGPAPHEVWYRSGARTLGQTGNNGSDDVSYSVSVSERSKARPDVTNSNAGLFRGGVNSGAAYADFAQSLDPINSYGQGSAGGAYTVRSGDSLQSIALGLYGDASLWYKLAEANGLSGAAALSEGMSLRLPSGVMRNHFNAGTLTPYDAGEAIGDLSPTTPKPPKNNKCAVVGQLLLAVVAIAVTALLTAGVGALATGASFSSSLGAVTGGSLATLGATATSAGLGATGAIAAGVAGAVGGSIVSQGLGVATGLQDKFSWKGVGLAALAGGIGGGINAQFGGGNWLASVGRGAASSAISQGIGVATGLQSKFSFAGVAAGVGAKIGGGSNFGGRLGVGAARLLASAATRSAIEGSSFGDNIRFGLPDVLAQTIVDTAIGAAARGSARAQAAALATQGSAASADQSGPPLSDAELAKRVGERNVATPQIATAATPASPVALTDAERQARIETALPDVIASIRAALTNPTLVATELADIQAAVSTLDRRDTSYAYGTILNQPTAAAAAGLVSGRGIITINPSSPILFNTDGTVNVTMLSSALVHEARHIYDARFYGGRNPSTVEHVRRTERNAYRTQAAYLKAIGGTVWTRDLAGVIVPLTNATANFAAEGSVRSWTHAAAIAVRQDNARTNTEYDRYLRRVEARNASLTPAQRRAGYVQRPSPRPTPRPIPVYTPPESY